MNKNFIGNDEAFAQMENYVRMEHLGPLILCGPKGTGKSRAALSLCSELLGCEESELSRQPDFYLLDKKGEAVKVEDVLAIILKSGVVSFRKRKVFLILGADRMNEQAQNKMLKLLEDRNRTNTVLFICEENRLLPTIKSRCMEIDFRHLPEPEMDAFLEKEGIDEKDRGLFGFLCGNCPYRADEVKECFPALKEIYLKILSLKDRRELFYILHLVKEKDPEEFYAAHSAHFDYALTMLLYVFMMVLNAGTKQESREDTIAFQGIAERYSPREAFEISSEILSHRSAYKRGLYSKNDFFDLARMLI